MAANKVIYGDTTLIDLTEDTVTEESLFAGYTAHKADGTVITGTAFADFSDELTLLAGLETDDGSSIVDDTGAAIVCRIIYRKV